LFAYGPADAFWYRLGQVVLEKRLINGCSSSSRPGHDRETSCCDERVCLSVCWSDCVSVCSRVYLQNYTSNLYLLFLHVTRGPDSSGGAAIGPGLRYVHTILRITPYLCTMGHIEAAASRISVSLCAC